METIRVWKQWIGFDYRLYVCVWIKQRNDERKLVVFEITSVGDCVSFQICNQDVFRIFEHIIAQLECFEWQRSGVMFGFGRHRSIRHCCNRCCILPNRIVMPRNVVIGFNVFYSDGQETWIRNGVDVQSQTLFVSKHETCVVVETMNVVCCFQFKRDTQLFLESIGQYVTNLIGVKRNTFTMVFVEFVFLTNKLTFGTQNTL